ncbi:MAG: hypothetical protein ACK5NA_01085 [Enterococcus sp.]
MRGSISTDYIQNQYSFVMKHYKTYYGYAKYQQCKISFLVNYLVVLFERRQYLVIPDVLVDLYDSSTDSFYINGRIFWRFFKGAYGQVNDDIGFDPSLIIAWIKSLGYEDLARQLTDFSERIGLNSVR